MRPRAPCSTGPCPAAWAFTHKNFDPAVAGTALGGVIGGDRVPLAHAIDRNTAAIHAPRCQIVARAGGAVHRQRVVDGIAARAVGMAHDAHIGVGVVAQALGELVQHWRKVGLNVRAPHGKRDVTRNIEHELVVGRLRDGDTGALRRALHVPLLALHVLRPDVGAQGPYARTHHGSGPCTSPCGGPDDGPCQRANARTRGGAALRVVHACATGGQNDDGADAEKNVFAHRCAPVSRDGADTAPHGFEHGPSRSMEPSEHLHSGCRTMPRPRGPVHSGGR